ncbi:hypothetical protein FGG79_07840 [Bacillus sp. BHET2]|uniref:DUF5667 domain-containing protein n=1 Tax=Bacillus sp. BHET2 TaxID=2583818 RepID=UPI0014862F35|nr:DUF5667 domain-containing protein [Bacillus sp. BHET2]TMU88009.1 hypothetical protein FGG79_07840 [Bacillus sp. BHET2]
MKKQQSKIMKSSLAVLVASSISFPSSMAFANTNDDNFDTIKLEQQNTTSKTDVAVNDEAMMESAKKEIEKLQGSAYTPSLLPGDFFYFAKLAIEKIQLAFTMDDAKEAKLLAEYAAERLAEVEALFKDGKQEEAIEALNKAIDMIDQSEGHWSDNENDDADKDSKETETDSDAKDEVKEETEKNENTEGTTNKESTADDSEIEGNTTSEGTETETEEASDEMTDIEELMSHNILSLKANLEKVKNPKAKEALQKNIEKSYIKLAEKLAKLEEKTAKNAAKEANKKEEKKSNEQEVDESASLDQDSESPNSGDTTDKAVDESTETTKEVTEKEEKEEIMQEEVKATPANVYHHTEKKEAKKEWKDQHKEVKHETKDVRKHVKEESKGSQHEKKDEKRQHPKNDKEARQHNNEKGKENGKGHHKE